MHKSLTIQRKTRIMEHMDGGSLTCSKCQFNLDGIEAAKLNRRAKAHLRENPTHTVSVVMNYEHETTYDVGLKRNEIKATVAARKKSLGIDI